MSYSLDSRQLFLYCPVVALVAYHWVCRMCAMTDHLLSRVPDANLARLLHVSPPDPAGQLLWVYGAAAYENNPVVGTVAGFECGSCVCQSAPLSWHPVPCRCPGTRDRCGNSGRCGDRGSAPWRWSIEAAQTAMTCRKEPTSVYPGDFRIAVCCLRQFGAKIP